MTAPPQGVEVDEIEFPAGKVRYYKAGTDGPPIVLLHGGGPDNALLSWRNTIGVLAADHRVYAPDLPGQGGSTQWRGRGNQRTFEEVLRWLLDAWRIPQATLVGLSMGGSIATGFTLRHPQRVRALALADSTGMQHRMPHHLLTYLLMRTDLSGRTAAKLLRSNRALVRFALNKVFFADASSVRDLESVVDEVRAEAGVRRSVFADWHADAINHRSMSINHLPQLERISCPVTVIHGEKDALVPVSSAQAVANAIPGAQLRIMPQAGHWPNRERPTEFNALLREFVNAVNAPAPAKGTNGTPKRDETAEAPTHRLNTRAAAEPPKPIAAAEETEGEKRPAADSGSVDAPTKMLKVGAGSAAAETGEESAESPEPSEPEETTDSATTAEPEESSEPAEASESTEGEESPKAEASAEHADAAAVTGSNDADTADESPDPKPADAKKTSTDEPTRFLKVDSKTENTTGTEEDDKPGTESEETPDTTSESPSDSEKPAKESPENSSDKPAT
ncbi:alpha/beta fold hydrolase [Saccharopolyspora dendranthemae]|uniref:Pimeloyl-ACP methyl ester carboxylesterase n=1 Tax=Saccharopolyspora dendranthemae TaxID=1181886 RepID=A0A561VBY7_9PSEU|nr:alpha/beta hydrolase [Saccharopolyspora dendranthemae]TWG09131.1 pimeloyl-ACP methyl ester carboxylesterase [Saccharopolyspora dendranthemae]